MPRNPGKRLTTHDYSAPGWYFVTIVVEGRRRLLGSIVDEECSLSRLGEAVAEAWNIALARRPWILCRRIVIMPDHVHALVGWRVRPDSRDATLGRLVARFKSESLALVRARRLLPSWDRFWQEGFWDRIIRNETELVRVERYIELNPLKAAMLIGDLREKASSRNRDQPRRERRGSDPGQQA